MGDIGFTVVVAVLAYFLLWGILLDDMSVFVMLLKTVIYVYVFVELMAWLGLF